MHWRILCLLVWHLARSRSAFLEPLCAEGWQGGWGGGSGVGDREQPSAQHTVDSASRHLQMMLEQKGTAGVMSGARRALVNQKEHRGRGGFLHLVGKGGFLEEASFCSFSLQGKCIK